jgi:perosamine synthetase
MTNMQAALGVAQLEQLDGFVERKREIGRFYSDALSDVSGLQHPVKRTDYAENIYWVYGIVIDVSHELDARGAMERLAREGIGTRPFFWPLHEQPVFRNKGMFEGESYPVAERIARRGFYLPSGLGITDEELERVAEVTRKVLG